MNKRKSTISYFLGAVMLCGLLLVSACKLTEQSNETPTNQPEQTPTQQPTATSAPTPEPEATPTAALEVTDVPQETLPLKVTLGNYAGLTLTNVTAEKVEEEIQTMLANFTTTETVDRAAQEGDTVNINFVGTLDGVAFEGGTDDSEEGTDLLLGSGQFIEGFEEALVGSKAGEVVERNIVFPDPYLNNPDLAGKPVLFTITVNSVMENKVPELTDDFIAENSDYTSAEEFRTAVKEMLNTEAYYEQLATILLSTCTVENISEAEVTAEAEAYVNQYLSMASYYASMFGVDTETVLLDIYGIASVDALWQYGYQYARHMITYSAILNEIAEVEQLELTQERFDAGAMSYAQQNGFETAEELIAQYGEDALRETLMLELAAEFCIENAVIKDAAE